MSELLKQFFVYGLPSTLGKFISFILLPIYTSIFTPEDYGYLDFIISITSILSIFGMLQIESGLQRFFYDQESECEKVNLVSTAFNFTLYCSLAIIFISILLIPYISTIFFENQYRIELLLSILGVLPSNLLVVVFVLLRFQKRTFKFAKYSIIQVLLSAILTVISVLYLKLGILGVIASTTFTSYAILVVSLLSLRSNFNFFKIDLKKLKQMLSYSAPQFPARIGSVANVYANRFFMISMLSATALGLYSVALKVASGMQLIQNAFMLTWLPFFYEILKKDDFKKRFLEVYSYILALLSVIVLILTLFSKEIILLLTNANYVESHKMVGILAYYYALFILKDVVDVGVKVTNKTQYNSYIYLFVSTLNVGLLFVLVPKYQLEGVCLSLLLSNLSLFLLTMWNSVKLYPRLQFPLLYTFFWIIMTTFSVIIALYIDLQWYIKIIVVFTIVIIVSIIFIRNRLSIKVSKK